MSSERIVDLFWQISWQTTLLAAVVWVIARIARRAPSAWKHGLWLVVLLKFLVPPLIPWPVLPEPDHTVKHSPPLTEKVFPPVLPTEVRDDSASVPPSHKVGGRGSVPIPSPVIGDLWRPRLLLGAWLAGAGLTAGLLAIRCVRQRKMVRRSVPAGEELLSLLAECAERLRVARVPQLRLSREAPTPMLLGIWRPVILLPMGITESCSPHDLRAMLLHELAHVRRWDLLIVWLYQLEKIPFFFHPVLWLAGREIRKERESACDELVLSRSAIARRDYAAGFISALRLANRVPAISTAVAMAEPFEVEKRRLMLILREASPRLSVGWMAGLMVVVVAGLPTFGGLVATQERPTPEAVSAALYKQVEACGDSLQLRYSVIGHPVKPPSLFPIAEVRYVRTPRMIFMEWEDSLSKDSVTKLFRDRVTKEEKRMVVQVPDGKALNGATGSGATSSMITLQHTMETAMLCLLGPDELLYECVRHGTVSERPEVVDDHRCWRIDIPAEKLLGSPYRGCSFTVWVDPDIGFCPRRLDRRSYNRGTDATDVATLRLRGYREVAKGVWFPTEHIVEGPSPANGTTVSTLRDIQVGKPVSPKDMSIEFPPDLPVQDYGEEQPSRARDRTSTPQTRPATAPHSVRDVTAGTGATTKASDNSTEEEVEETERSSAPGWHNRFDQVYRLDEGQVLKRIVAPFIPERHDYYRNVDQQQARLVPRDPDYYLFRWDGRLEMGGEGFGADALLMNILKGFGLARFDYDGERGLLRARIAGDWIVRQGAPPDACIAELEKILRKDPETQFRFTRKQVERTVLVARGKFKLHPLEDPPHGSASVHIFTDRLDRRGSDGQGGINEFLRAVGESLNCPVINATGGDESTRIHWVGNRSGYVGDLPDGEDKDAFIQQVTANLAKQTSLNFVTERRKVEVWFISEDDASH